MDVDLLYKYWYTGTPVKEMFAYNTYIEGTDLFFIDPNPYPGCKTNLWIQIKMRRVPRMHIIKFKYAKSIQKAVETFLILWFVTIFNL
jgi:hypothetical protein